MQFVFILGGLMLAAFLGVFLITGITESLKDISLTAPTNYGYGGYQTGAAFNAVKENETSEFSDVPNPRFEGRTITSVLETLPSTERFKELFETGNGEQFLVEPTLYTLFVPTDEAFSKLPYEAQVAINTMDEEELKRFVTHHLVPQKMVAVGGQKAGTVTAISRDTLNFMLWDGGGTVGNARVVHIHNTEDGIVYVVDGVLLPPKKTIPNVTF